MHPCLLYCREDRISIHSPMVLKLFRKLEMLAGEQKITGLIPQIRHASISPLVRTELDNVFASNVLTLTTYCTLSSLPDSCLSMFLLFG